MVKNTGKLTWVILALVSLCSCSAYKASQQYEKLRQPQLGTLVQQNSMLGFAEHTQEVGQLHLKKPLAVKVFALPFNDHSYGVYTSYLKNARRANTIPYNDSTPIPPRYLRLQLADQVVLTQLLNTEENKALCEYSIQDADYALVSSIDFTSTDRDLAVFFNASHVFLTHDDLGKLYLSLEQNNKELVVYFEELQIFEFETLSFCWDEDEYLKKRIVSLINKGQKCPKGTHKKARKAERERDYLKF